MNRCRVRSNSKPKPGGIERAVVNDAERQSVSVRQTAGSPQDSQDQAAGPSSVPPHSALQPVPVENAPVLPNISSVSGPQYFSAIPPGSSNVIPVHPGSNWQTYQAPMQIQNVSQGQYFYPASSTSPAGPAYTGGGMMTPQPNSGYYPMSSARPVSANRSGSVSVTDSRHSAANGRSRHHESGVPSARDAVST